MKVNATKSTQITLEHCEVLDKDGNYFNNIMGAGGVGKGCDRRTAISATVRNAPMNLHLHSMDSDM